MVGEMYLNVVRRAVRGQARGVADLGDVTKMISVVFQRVVLSIKERSQLG